MKEDYLIQIMKNIGQESFVPYQRGLTRDQINSMGVVDKNEKLIKLEHERIVMMSNSLSEQYPICRESAGLKFIEVAEKLPERLSLGLIELFRPLDVQIQKRKSKFEELSKIFPEKSESDIWRIVDEYIARPGGPHQTGGVGDVVLVWKDTGEALDMGTNYGLPDKKSYTNSKDVSWEARVHRCLLWSYMTSVGFRNYPSEWWHYEYGTKRWAKYLGLDYAFYDPVVI